MSDFTISAARRSVKGQYRCKNEDRVCIAASDGIFLLADGMGGLPGGELASTLAVQSARRTLRVNLRSGGESAQNTTELIQGAFRRANETIFQEATRNLAFRRMGTTLVLLLLRGNSAYTAGLGDSRVYHVRGGQIAQLTEDHSLGQFLLNQGQVTLQQLRFVRRRNALLRHLGREPHVPPEVRSLAIERGDHFVLVSDGLNDVVPDSAILEVVTRPATPRSIAQQLVSLALQSGSRDNISCVVVSVA